MMKYLKGAILVSRCALLYPLSHDTPKILKLLHKIWGIVIRITFIVMIFQCFMYFATKKFDLVEDAMIVVHSALYTFLFMNIYFYGRQRDKLVKLVNNINQNFVESTDNPIETITMEPVAKAGDILAYLWSSGCIVSTLAIGILPIFYGEIPVKIWFPYDYHSSELNFKLTCIWQLYAQSVMGFMGASDMFYPSMSLLLGQQFRILSSNFRNYYCKALIDSGFTSEEVLKFDKNFNSNNNNNKNNDENDAIYRYVQSEEFNRRNLLYFRENIRRHKLLLKIADDFNSVFSTIVLFKITTASFYVVFISFSIITVKTKSIVYALSTYIFFSTSQFLVYCLGGQFISENSDFIWKLYETPWYLCDEKFKKSLLIVQIRIKKVFYHRGGNFFVMIAPSLVQFFKTIFSYVAVLRTLSDKDDNDGVTVSN